MDDTGFVAVTGGNIWYRRLGEGPATPVFSSTFSTKFQVFPPSVVL